MFGRPPVRPVHCRLDYEPEPQAVIGALTQFIYTNAKLIDFADETVKKNFWVTILNGVLNEASSAHRVFKTNLDVLIKENMEENGGYDPRVDGPPEHIAN